MTAHAFRTGSVPDRLLRSGLAALLLGGTLIVAAYRWFGVGGDLRFAIGGVLYDAVVLGAGLACLVRASSYGRERAAWTLIGLAILSWGAAEVYWTVAIEGNPSAPYPSPADVGYLAFYPLASAGLAVLVRARAHQLNWRLWMDGAIAALGTATLGAAFVFDGVSGSAGGSSLQAATTLAYPLGDILLLAIVVGVVALTGWRPGRTWSLLLAGVAALVVADMAYTLQIDGGALPPGSWIDPIYLIAAACLGAVVWQPAEAAMISSPDDGNRRRDLVVPVIFAGVMVGLILMQYFNPGDGLSRILRAATIVAVIVRLAMSDRENRTLLEQVRTDSLTGLGSRGRVEIDLPDRIAEATPERPVSLVLLDLNGFKQYNDSLGHPAGDALLTRLGAALRSAVGPAGTAYRFGGDEFCLLLTCAPERFVEVARAAADSLSARGPGYEINASWGAVRIPGEALDVDGALELADARMYADKVARRAAISLTGPTAIAAAAPVPPAATA
ncbi:MAG TPA: GGDEF domain-containing protein [Solirubrobacterales bacterium]